MAMRIRLVHRNVYRPIHGCMHGLEYRQVHRRMHTHVVVRGEGRGGFVCFCFVLVQANAVWVSEKNKGINGRGQPSSPNMSQYNEKNCENSIHTSA